MRWKPSIPTRGTKVPAGPDWIHEIKHDGYRLIVQREGKRVRLLTRRGYDWSDRYPLIVQSALRLRKTSFVIDGEALTRIQILPLAIIAAAVVAFGVLLQPLGLVLSLALVTVVSAFASRESKPMEVAALTCVLAAFAAGVFVYGLRLPLPLWPAMIG